MRLALLAAATLCASLLALPACDSPGGGKGGGTQVVADASGGGGGGTTPTIQIGGAFCQQARTKLTSCAVLTAGTWPCEEPPPEGLCGAQCLMQLSCDDLKTAVCTEFQTLPASAASCYAACPQPSEIPCADGSGTYPADYKCDGYDDCSDGSDEAGCPAPLECADGNGTYPTQYKCDGNNDCSDGSDEEGCPAGTHFVCADGTKTGVNNQCDGDPDCQDGSDEAGCPPIAELVCPGQPPTPAP